MRVDSLRRLDDLYVGGGSIFRLAADGTQRWRATSPEGIHTPATGGGPAYLATESGVVLALLVRSVGREFVG